MLALKKTLPHGGPAFQAGMFRSPGMVDRGHAGTFTRASVATAPDHNGKYRPVKTNEPGIWGGVPTVRTIRQSSHTLSAPPTPRTAFLNWAIDEANQVAYAAGYLGGVFAFDISDPAALTLLDNIRAYSADNGVGLIADRMQGICLSDDGTRLYAVTRTGVNGTGTGRLLSYNVEDPANIVHIATESVTGDLYTDCAFMVIGGTNYVAVAGQLSGFWLWDVSDPANMVIAGSLETGFETQGLAVQGDYAYVCNYDETQAFRVIDCSTPASPSIVGSCPSPATIAGVALRPWECVVDGDYAYVCGNTSAGVGDSPLRGLLTVDVSTPASVTDWLGYAAIDAADNDTWLRDPDNPASDLLDRPNLGIKKHGHFVYIANGQRGHAAFDVKDPANPRYIGLVGTDIPASTNLLAVSSFTLGEVDYLIYGDGVEAASDASAALYQKYNVYIDKIAYGFERDDDTKGILLEGVATNVLTDPDAPASQVTGSLATGDWTLSCQGSGSITPVAITAVGTGFAAATEGSPNTFNLSGAGTVDLTVAGDLDWIQLEAGAFNTSFVDGARALHSFTIPAPYMFKPNNMCGYFEYTPHIINGPTAEQALFYTQVGSHEFRCWLSNNNKIWLKKITAGTPGGVSVGVGSLTLVAGTKLRIAWRLQKGVGMDVWVNGTKGSPLVTDDTDITTTGTIYFGRRAAGTFPCYGAIGNRKVWHKPLSDTFLANYGA